MAHFLRGKQSGIHGDLSAGLAPEHFVLDDVARYGINSRISTLAYDPVQSLLAVGTSETQYGSGQIYIFGQERVSAVFTLPRKASVNILQFCTDKIVSVDSKHELCVFSLEKRTKLAAYTPPGHVTALLTDPSLEYAFIGLQSGELVTYDLDRLMIAPFKLPNLWKERSPRSRLLPIVSLAFHPRDIGKLLIGYLEGAVTFSIKMNVPLKYFQYEVPPGAPGGDSDPSSSREVRRPRLTKAVWHPTGTFILTAHDDSSLVFWDPKDGRIVMARTLVDTDVNKAGAVVSPSSLAGTYSLKEPIFQVAWCCKENPDDTGLLIAGGGPTTEVNKHLTFFDLGPTPNYQTSSWQILSNHLAKPRRETKLPTPPAAEVVDFVLIPRSSPFFANAQDPIAVITLLSSGELVTLSFPSGHPISPTNMLHLSLSFVHPFVNKIALSYVDRTRWLGWREKRAHGPNIVIGGAAAKKPMKRYENRDIVQTAHADGIIRMWDSGHDDHVENPATIQVDLARAVGRFHDIEVSAMSLAGAAGEFSAGLRSGEVAIFKWGRNPNEDRDLPLEGNYGPGRLTDISRKADPGLKEGFLPVALLNQGQGSVTALEHSDVGFICVGFQSGNLAIVDLRGPSVIFTANSSELTKPQKRLSLRKSHHSASEASPEWPTSIKFAVMTLDGDDYSSILCLVGTSKGSLATFKILPSGGTYTVSFVGSRNVDDRVLSICPINAENGVPALASQDVVAKLRNGYQVNGVVIAVTPSGCRMFKPASAKGAEKDWDDFLCDSATVVRTEERSSLVGVFGDGKARAYSIPALKEISSAPIDNILDMRRLGEAVISPSGDVIGWTGPSELAMLSLWGAGLPLRRCDDAIYNPGLSAPSRPTISNMQWISGTQYVTPSDMDLLIGGPDRPPSKHMIEQMRQEEISRQAGQRGPSQGNSTNASQTPGASNEGYWAYMQRQVQQRTENLNIMGDSINRLEETSSGWAEDVNKYVKNQKKKAVLGVIGSKFGF
ncbi:SNARE-dependent exocytosis protein [Histoplasma capsulatum var. duboisii H88]|uniref:SNARE-dependent exocytosis protein n=1 Tax=Ajellomyces capsulatus (strain H88) TaxID=544711 RepID=F0U7I9_AJEC8|nr:SNARE-dependent exocytosis protein [Histoplasma capsulatum var. duboisii H88]QSS52796.1 SNARE-dependent exocytosis protein [Histoplasma capsulatum var. duboisii H88]